MRRAVWMVPAVLLLLGGKLDRLSDAEQSHYRALRIFLDEKEQKEWLKLKTEDERNAWLVEHNLWDKFYSHDEATRQQIIEGDVELGWSRDMVYMAWGAPFQKQRLTGRQATRSEALVYRFEVDKKGYASPVVGAKVDYKAVDRYEVRLVIDDDIVAEMDEHPGWE
jgi:hypothetical protein